MSKANLYLFISLLTGIMFLSACGSNENTATEDDDTETESTADSGDTYSYTDFEPTVSNQGEPTGEGALRIGYVRNESFIPVLSPTHSASSDEFELMRFFFEPLLTYDEEYQYTNDGAMEFEIDEDARTVTFTIKEGINWHDGEPLTINDYIASYEVIGSPDYEGVNGMTDGFTLLEGFEEYRAGDSDEISGIEVIDDYTAVFTYEEIAPSFTAGGLWQYAFPEHHYEGVPVEEIPEASQSLEDVIGFGPYKLDEIIPGEHVIFSKNEDYWRGEPQLDGIDLRFIDTSTIGHAVESGEVDVALGFPSDQYPDLADIENVEWIGSIDSGYSYIGFKMGEWDTEENRVIYEPENYKMGDVNLRRAMWHALNLDAVGERFYNGLRWQATSPITPAREGWHHEDLDVPEYDPDEANRILDEAGYEDVDGDGFRETPDGEPLEINYAAMSGGDTAEPLNNYYIQEWRNIGLNVQLLHGRLHEPTSFYSMVQYDEPEVDIFSAGFGVGQNVDPSDTYGVDAYHNFSRYESEENTRLLEEGNSAASLDTQHRIDTYKEWQELMVEDIPIVPLMYSTVLKPVSTNVMNWSDNEFYEEDFEIYRVGFEETPEPEE